MASVTGKIARGAFRFARFMADANAIEQSARKRSLRPIAGRAVRKAFLRGLARGGLFRWPS